MQPCRPVRYPRLNKRGVTGAVFAITAAILIGASAIATEAALWYLGQEQAYGVADAAALAGVVQYVNSINSGESLGAAGSDAQAAATTVAGMNGFGAAQTNTIAGAASSVVTANNPPSTGVFAPGSPQATPSATEVIINIDYPTFLASVFHAADINVGARAVAYSKPVGQACLLSLSGDLTINMSVQGTACYLASNATDATSVTVADSVNFSIFGITTEGACVGNGCLSANPLWGSTSGDGSGVARPAAAYQLPTTNPLAGLGPTASNPTAPDLIAPAASQIVCPLVSSLSFGFTNPPPSDPAYCTTTQTQIPLTISASATLPPTQPDNTTGATIQSVCGTVSLPNVCAYYNMDITINSAVALLPGTYLLVNSSLTVNSTARVTCSPEGGQVCGGTNLSVPTNGNIGVTIILVGASGDLSTMDAGKLYIDPGASVNISAPGTASYPSSTSGLLNGVLFYRDPSHLMSDTAATPAVQIAGNNLSLLQGVMYFPGAGVHAWFAGNTGSAQLDCAIVIADTLNIGWPVPSSSLGNSVGVNDSCPGYNLNSLQLPTVQAAALGE